LLATILFFLLLHPLAEVMEIITLVALIPEALVEMAVLVVAVVVLTGLVEQVIPRL